MSSVIKVENLSKAYQLGDFGTGTISRDLQRAWARARGKEDPFLKIGEVNDRTKKGESDVVWSLRNLNFEIEQGDAVGIIGRNGAGKSTLLKILSRVTSPTTGNIKVKGRIASLLEVGTGFHPELTGRENIFLNGAILGMRRTEIKRKFDEIVDFSGVERYIDTPVKRYSSGMYVRLAFAVAAHLESEILIVDEVLAVGDAEFQKKCLGKIGDVSKGEGRTVLFVSHNTRSIKQLCSKAILLRNGAIVADGLADKIIDEYLSENKIINTKREYKAIVDFVEVVEKGGLITIRLKYRTDDSIDIPHLGFVIFNSEGVPVFGSNPTIANIEISKIPKYQEGLVEVNVISPRLYDGIYRLAIWFGDSKKNFFSDEDCLLFEISGILDKSIYSVSTIGNISPKTTWTFR